MMHADDEQIAGTAGSSKAASTRRLPVARRVLAQTSLLAVVVFATGAFTPMMKMSDTRSLQTVNKKENRETAIPSQSPPSQATVNETTRLIPSVLLAGTQKAGTSSVAGYLWQFNHTCFSDPTLDMGIGGSFGKEPHFFDHHYEDGLVGYQDLFKFCNHSNLLIDGTPETMMTPDRVRDIYDEQGTADSVKIIFILREPVDREVSWYHHRLRYVMLPEPPDWVDDLMTENGTVKSFIQVCRENVMYTLERERYHNVYAHYAYWLKRWSSLFDRKQILVLSYDEMSRDVDTFLRRVHSFLDIPLPANTSALSLPRINTASGGSDASSAKKPPQPPCLDQLELAQMFEQPNEELYAFMDQHPGPSMEQRPFPRFQLRCNSTQSKTLA